MKFIIGFVLSIFLLFIAVSCSNDEGVSSLKSRKDVEYYDFQVYRGSDNGAIDVTQEYIKKKIGDKIVNNKDSLYRTLIVSQIGDAFKNENKISFEFLEDNNMLSFTDENKQRTIISSYEFIGDTLFVLQKSADKEEMQLVAIREADGDAYFRTKSGRKFILKENKENGEEDKEEEKDPNPKFLNSKEGLFSEENVFDYKYIKDKASMFNEEDTVVWCNVKYIYE